MWGKFFKQRVFYNRGSTYFQPLLIVGFVIIAVVAISLITSISSILSSPSIASAKFKLESNGYVVMSSAEYDALYVKVDETWKHDHSEQYVAPLAAPITLTSGAGSYELGAFSDDFLAAGATTDSFDIMAIGFGTPDINGTYTVILYAGNSDTEIGQVSFNRQGVFTSSIYRDMRTVILPAGTRIRAKMMDQTGGATCVSKIYYHYN